MRKAFYVLLLAMSFSLYSMDFFENSVDEIIREMTLKEKIGQLFIIPTYMSVDDPNFCLVEDLIKKRHVGGVISKAVSYEEHLKIIDKTFPLSKQPLLSVFDAESGLGFRIKDIPSFPQNLILGREYTDEKIEEIGELIGRQCKEASIHVNLAPVVDINSNPNNPIIGPRSFGNNPLLVSKKAKAMIVGMQKGGVYPCIKHFPGHGDVAVDSHKAMPVVAKGLEELKDVELMPFQEVIDTAGTMVMSAHLFIPLLDAHYPASLSKLILRDLLRTQMGFEGIIISDALNMKALTRQYTYEEIAILAFQAGTDLLLYGDHINSNITEILACNVSRSLDAIYSAVLSGEINESQIDEKVRKILLLKQQVCR